MTTAAFYFDYVSPYAYLAWKRAKRVLPALPLAPRPVLLGVLLAHFGQLGPAEIPSKRVFTIRDTLRRAADADLPLAWPLRHPFKSVLAARATLAVLPESRANAIDAFFDAAWGRGEDLEDTAVVHSALAGAGLDAEAVLARAGTKEVSDALREENRAAIERGIFGVPIIALADDLFFGDDQLVRVAKLLNGQDPLDRAKAAEVESRPMGVVRTRVPGS